MYVHFNTCTSRYDIHPDTCVKSSDRHSKCAGPLHDRVHVADLERDIEVLLPDEVRDALVHIETGTRAHVPGETNDSRADGIELVKFSLY